MNCTVKLIQQLCNMYPPTHTHTWYSHFSSTGSYCNLAVNKDRAFDLTIYPWKRCCHPTPIYTEENNAAYPPAECHIHNKFTTQ